MTTYDSDGDDYADNDYGYNVMNDDDYNPTSWSPKDMIIMVMMMMMMMMIIIITWPLDLLKRWEKWLQAQPTVGV